MQDVGQVAPAAVAHPAGRVHGVQRRQGLALGQLPGDVDEGDHLTRLKASSQAVEVGLNVEGMSGPYLSSVHPEDIPRRMVTALWCVSAAWRGMCMSARQPAASNRSHHA